MEEQKPHEQKEDARAICGLILGFLLGFLLVYSTLPVGSHPRELRERSLCAINLNSIGKGMVIFQAEHEDIFPPNLHTLVLEGETGLKMFVCPSAGTKHSLTTAPTDFREHCDYIFTLCNQPAALPSDLLCAYELPLNHDQEYVNWLYSDTHVAGAYGMSGFQVKVQKVNDFLAEKRGGGQ
ncbi:MAG TPA: hypothetical protein ENH84_07115 [Phycisphaerae bacterium]|nr:hypothetical protein [Phycisphaerae bacterium]